MQGSKKWANTGTLLILAMLALIAPRTFSQDAARSGPRVGVDSTKRISLTLRDAMLMALENNRDIEIERLNVQMTGFDLVAAQGFYDPSLLTSFYYDRRNTPVANPLAGGSNGGLLTDNVTGAATFTQRIQQHGGLLQAAFNTRDRSRSAADQDRQEAGGYV
jgi:outer membrane protein